MARNCMPRIVPSVFPMISPNFASREPFYKPQQNDLALLIRQIPHGTPDVRERHFQARSHLQDCAQGGRHPAAAGMRLLRHHRVCDGSDLRLRCVPTGRANLRTTLHATAKVINGTPRAQKHGGRKVLRISRISDSESCIAVDPVEIQIVQFPECCAISPQCSGDQGHFQLFSSQVMIILTTAPRGYMHRHEQLTL